MNVQQLKSLLQQHSESSLRLQLPSGEFIPEHFHVTEVGRVDKTFVDCGGTRRQTASCLLQTSDALTFVLVGKQTDCLAKDQCGVGECGAPGCCE